MATNGISQPGAFDRATPVARHTMARAYESPALAGSMAGREFISIRRRYVSRAFLCLFIRLSS
jgi:hypothetical protein